jgi:tetratricopeptide (TPR) repeat protein
MSTATDLFSLAWKYHQAGNLAHAEQLYRQLLGADPSHADGWCFLGAACLAQGKSTDAETYFRRALQIVPDYVSAHTYLGMLLAQQGRFDEAVESFHQGIRAQPQNAEIHNNLGLALARQGKMGEAVASYRHALRLSPDYAAAHYNLGLALNGQGHLDAAVIEFQQALQCQPHYPEAWNDLANALAQQQKLDEAVNAYRNALQLRPQYAECQYNLGVVLVKQAKHEAAIAHYQEALRITPDYADAHYNLANALHGRGMMQEALTHYLRAQQLRPHHPETNLSCALLWLILGDFEHGWPAYEWRRRQPDSDPPRPFKQPLWDGLPLNGRTVLLHAELGLGDTLQFIRFAPQVKQRGGKVIAECPSSLTSLLASAKGIDHLVPRGSVLPAFDSHAPLLSLPGILRTTLATLPKAIPYLGPAPELVNKWRRTLPKYQMSEVASPMSNQAMPTSDIGCTTPAFRVGIAWQGNPAYGHDEQRSIPLAAFEPLTQVPGVQLISLQKGVGTEQLEKVKQEKKKDFALCFSLDESKGAFMDTAALMSNLDLVICSDTSIPHLAGALAVPVWVALPKIADWRWLLERQDSPWYPTMRLFRQTRNGDWLGVFGRIAEELKRVVSSL